MDIAVEGTFGSLLFLPERNGDSRIVCTTCLEEMHPASSSALEFFERRHRHGRRTSRPFRQVLPGTGSPAAGIKALLRWHRRDRVQGASTLRRRNPNAASLKALAYERSRSRRRENERTVTWTHTK
jgi:hypothetical protein